MAPSRCTVCGNLTRFCTCNKGPLPTGPTPFEVQYDSIKAGLRADEAPNPHHFVVNALGGDPEIDGIYLCERGCGITTEGECLYGGFHLDDGHRDEVTHLVVRTAMPDHARPTRFYLTLLDPRDLEADMWGLTVCEAGGGYWAIYMGGWTDSRMSTSLGRDETWGHRPLPQEAPGGGEIPPTDEEIEAFRAVYRWKNVNEALAFAEAYLPKLVVSHMTTEQMIARRAENGTPTPFLKEHLG